MAAELLRISEQVRGAYPSHSSSRAAAAS
jgi:hypothetical protein